jgi:hypothetical protein
VFGERTALAHLHEVILNCVHHPLHLAAREEE